MINNSRLSKCIAVELLLLSMIILCIAIKDTKEFNYHLILSNIQYTDTLTTCSQLLKETDLSSLTVDELLSLSDVSSSSYERICAKYELISKYKIPSGLNKDLIKTLHNNYEINSSLEISKNSTEFGVINLLLTSKTNIKEWFK